MPKPTSTRYRFILDVEVHTPGLLFANAIKHAEQSGLTHRQAARLLGSQSKVDIEACLVQLLDPSVLPGCEIDESDCERLHV
jgi:hypothetical protein